MSYRQFSDRPNGGAIFTFSQRKAYADIPKTGAPLSSYTAPIHTGLVACLIYQTKKTGLVAEVHAKYAHKTLVVAGKGIQINNGKFSTGVGITLAHNYAKDPKPLKPIV